MGVQSKRSKEEVEPTQAFYWDDMNGEWDTIIYFSNGSEEDVGKHENPEAARAALKKRAHKLGYPDLPIMASVL